MTVTDQSVDLDLVAHDHEEDLCHECEAMGEAVAEAVAHARFTSGCEHSPALVLLCAEHYQTYVACMHVFGTDQWGCRQCAHVADLVYIGRGKP